MYNDPRGDQCQAVREEIPEFLSEPAKESWRLGEGVSSDEEESDELMDDEDDDEEFPWVKNLTASVNKAGGMEVGRCQAKLIDRESIRNSFWSSMEEPSQDTAELAKNVFDRWGRLQPVLREHPVKKGTGVWGKELDRGRFMLIETLRVQPGYRRQGFGSKLVADIWEQAQRIAPDCAFIIVWAIALNNDAEVAAAATDLSPNDARDVYERAQGASEDFWRCLGFRRIGSSPWLARAKDPNHPSHSLSAIDDYRRPFALRMPPFQKEQVWPYNVAMIEANDDQTLTILVERLNSTSANSSSWLSINDHGDTLMHFLAKSGKSKSLAWLLGQSFANKLSESRNFMGETSLEALTAVLEAHRNLLDLYGITSEVTDASDGSTNITVKCLRLLQGHDSMNR